MSNQYADPYTRIRKLERERDEAGDDARAAIRDALLLKEQAERERDEARKERDVAFEDLEQADKERGEWKNRYHTADTQALKLAEALRPFAEFSGPYPPELHAAAHRALAEWEKP